MKSVGIIVIDNVKLPQKYFKAHLKRKEMNSIIIFEYNVIITTLRGNTSCEITVNDGFIFIVCLEKIFTRLENTLLVQ